MDHKKAYPAIDRFFEIDCYGFSNEARFALSGVLYAISADRVCDKVRLTFYYSDGSKIDDKVNLGITLAIDELNRHSHIKYKTGSAALFSGIEVKTSEDDVTADIEISPCLTEWAVTYIGKKYINSEKAIKKRAGKIQASIDNERLFYYVDAGRVLVCGYMPIRERLQLTEKE